MRFNRVKCRRYQEPENGGEGGGGSGSGEGNPNPKTTDKEAELLKEVMKKKEDLAKAKDQLKAEAEARAALEAKLKEFDGIDVSQVRKALEDQKAAELKKLEEKGEFEKIRQQMVAEHESAVAKLRQETEANLSELQKALNSREAAIVDLTIGRSFGDSSFVRDSLTLTPAKARVVYGSHFEIKDGAVVAYDKPAGASDRTILVDGKGKPLAFDEALQKIVEADPDKDQLLRSKLSKGAGSRSDGDGKPPVAEVGSGRDRIAAAVAAGKLSLPGAK